MSVTLNWLGLSCFKISTKIGEREAEIVTDPYNPNVGLKLPRSLSADIVTISRNDDAHGFIEGVGGNYFLMKTPGEVEVKQIFIYGIQPKQSAGAEPIIFYRFEIGDISVAHLGDSSCEFSAEELEQLEDVDILLVQVGASAVKQTVDLVNQIQPRIVIPMYYKIPGVKAELLPLEKFLKELGVKSETMPKLKIAKKDLPQDNMRVIILERS